MKRLVGGVVAVVVLLALGVVVDRVAVGVAENRVVSSLEEGADAVSGATADVAGFPFLTQLAAGRLSDVVVTAESATFGGYTVTDVRAEASGISTAEPYVVEQGTASALLGIDQVQDAVREQSRLAVDVSADRSALRLDLDAFGLEVAVATRVRVAGPTTIALDIETVTLGPAVVSVDDLPGVLADALTDLEVALELPSGVALEQIVVEGDALRVDVTGTNVVLDELVTS
ncbi:LmeA family phospholipid-binding protein [Oerskovia flava]|uniref:LmeA family phospholipid-binding protein n=1 Tax=Oerskovia flava TaxID=2986422 RepID=UPI002240B5AA|nr:DUF2993 domain-containing protein [Oerskovia sp. JB1-3-2]